MVGHTLHTAFRSWFKDTESDGTPLLPAPLSKKYTVLPQVLGQGSFAVVKACVERATGVERALKIIAKKPLKDSNEQMLKEEIAILGKVEHPNIIKMWDLYESKEGVFIVTDLCRGGELFDQLVEKVHYNELDARHIVRQIFEGVAYLHTHDIIHRDLKPENILLRDKSEHSQIVISDFGLSRFIPDEGLLMTACGSPQYVAPEVLLGKGYGPGVDIWSGGVIAYCLLGGYTPFYGDDQPTLFQQILAMQVEFDPQYWEGISDTAKDFICKCLCPTDKRMTADQALQHPWISDLPKLDHDTPSEHRGVCLKERAKRQHSTRSSLNRAVTAVETVAYLQKLHKLRQDHAQDVQPDKLHALLRVATNISLHRRGDSLMASPLSRSAELPTTNFNGNGNGGFFEGDSAATLTPEPSQMGDSQPPSSKSSRMDVELCIMGGTAPVPSKSGGGGGTASVAAAAAETAHGENPTGNSLGRPVEDDEVQQQTGQGRVSPTRSQSSSSDVTATPARRASTTKKSSSSSKNNNAAAAKSGGSNTLDTLLDQYKTTQIPSSSRVDMTAPSTVPEGMSLAKAWRYVPFLVNQGISIGSAIASHAVYGPAKKSWGIEMSLFTRIMRDASQYTEFATVAGLQSFFDLSSFLPVPKDGLITPVTFRVKKRNLRGMLAEADAKEDGKRELTGEWVVGKQTWRRLQSEWRSGKSRDRERVILYIHGGAYFVMSAATHRPLTISLSKYTECRVFGINYRLAPDTQFPGPLHDVVSAWFRLVDDLGIPPGNIVLGADSAGGGLALALMYYLRDNKYDLPSGAILFSPWVDLTLSCDSWETNAKFDYLPMPASGNHMNPVSAYLGENIDKYITHPYASPLFGDMHGLPPLLIQCGDAEVLRDEVTLLAHKASVAGVAVRHELYEDCVHVFQAFLFLDASRKALQSARHFVRTALDKRGRRKAEQQEGSRKEVDAEMRAGMKNEKGERVEPRTGEREGDWRNTRGAESDSESGARGEEAGDRSNDDDWADFERASISKAASAAAKAPAKVAQKVTGADDASVTRQQREQLGAGANDMRRSQSQPNDGGSPIPSATRKDSASSTSSSNNARRHRATSSMSMSFSAARDRAEAGMRVQEGPQAPALPKFSDPAPGSVHPRMRRTASSAQVQNLLQGFEQDSSSLHTRVFPATPGA